MQKSEFLFFLAVSEDLQHSLNFHMAQAGQIWRVALPSSWPWALPLSSPSFLPQGSGQMPIGFCHLTPGLISHLLLSWPPVGIWFWASWSSE